MNGGINLSDIAKLVDLLRCNRPSPTSFRIDPRLFEEVTVDRFDKFKISIDGKIEQHKEAHFHVYVNCAETASFEIKTGKPFKSSLEWKDDRTIAAWTKEHQEKLLFSWNIAVEKGRAIKLDTIQRNEQTGELSATE
jgi:hypothetical protein